MFISNDFKIVSWKLIKFRQNQYNKIYILSTCLQNDSSTNKKIFLYFIDMDRLICASFNETKGNKY